MLEEHTTELRRRLREARARARDAETIVREGFRRYFSFIVEDRPLFEMLRRNAGTVRELFDTPALRERDPRAAARTCARWQRAASCRAALDLDALAAAMGGVAFELGIRLSEQDPPDVERDRALRERAVPRRDGPPRGASATLDS